MASRTHRKFSTAQKKRILLDLEKLLEVRGSRTDYLKKRKLTWAHVGYWRKQLWDNEKWCCI